MKIFLKILAFLVLLVVVVLTAGYFAINSTYAAQKLTDKYAGKFGFTFGAFNGNAVEGVGADGIYFQGKKLANSVKVKISPVALLNRNIKMTDVLLDGVNKKNLFEMVDYFVQKSKKNKSDDTSAGFSYEIDNGVMNVLPYKIGGIDIEGTHLSTSYLFYKKGLFEGDIESIVVESKLGDMSGSCSFREKVLRFDNLVARDMNTLEIEKILKKGKESNKTATKEKNITKSSNPFVPSRLEIKSASIDLLPRSMVDMNLSKTKLKVENFDIDFVEEKTSGKIWLKSGNDIAKLESTIELTPEVVKFKEINLKRFNLTKLESYMFNRVDNGDKFTKIPYLPTKLSIGKLKVSKIYGKYNGAEFTNGSINASGNSKMVDLLNKNSSLLLKGSVVASISLGKESLEIKSSSDSVEYWMNKKIYNVAVDAKIATKYSKNISLKTEISNRYGLEYKLKAVSPSVEVGQELSGLLSGLSVDVIGNKDNIEGSFKSDYLKGKIVSKDQKMATVQVSTIKKISLKKYFVLPDSVLNTDVDLDIEAPVRLGKIFPIEAKVKMRSNLINIDGVVYYHKSMRVDGSMSFPENTLLKGMYPKVKYGNLNPMKLEFEWNSLQYRFKFKHKDIVLRGTYNSGSRLANANIEMLHSKTTLKSKGLKSIKLLQKSSSLKSMLQEIDKFYPVDDSSIDGDVQIDADIDMQSGFSANVKSSILYFGEDKKRTTKLKNISMSFSGDSGNVVLSRYTIDYKNNSFFATKPSKVSIKNGLIMVDPLWVNDKMQTSGQYDTNSGEGTFYSKGSGLEIKHEFITTVSSMDLDSKITKNRKSFSGTIRLDGGEIKYDLQKATIATDSDIIVLQRVQERNDNEYIKNVKLDIKLESSKALVYSQKDLHIKMIPNLYIKKEYGKSAVLKGEVTLLKDGYYVFEGKKFVLKKSHIYFKKNSLTPVLDIKAYYTHAAKSTLISVTGTSKNPVLNFNSASKGQVISDILFDTEGGANDGEDDDVGRLLAGSVAKKLLRGMGLEVDHLVFSGNGFEIGKKISKKVTVIYDQEESSSLKVRIENNKRVETDISFGTESGSIDMYYKKEF